MRINGWHLLTGRLSTLTAAFTMFVLGTGYNLPAQTHLSDDFSDASLDTAKWRTILPYSSSSVTQSGGAVTTTGRGILASVNQFTAPYVVSGVFTMLNDYEHFDIILRTDLSTLGASAYYGRLGITVTFINDGKAVSIQQFNRDATWTQLATTGGGGYAFVTGRAYSFSITDTGSAISVAINGTTIVTANTTFSYGNYLAFYSREFSSTATRIDSVTVAATPSVAPDYTTGLVTSLQFDGNTNDSSANRFTFTEAGSMRYAADRFGNAGRALEFVTAPSDSIFLRGTGPDLANKSSSIAFWVKKNYAGSSNGGWKIFTNAGPGSDRAGKSMQVCLDYGVSIRYSFFYDDFDNNSPLDQGRWYHLAFTFDYATRARCIYINGALIATNQAAFPFTGGNLLQFSSIGLTLDDVRLYTRTLNAADVAALASLPAPSTVPPVITTQPQAQTVTAGGNVTFSVTASGTTLLTYQWRKDGVNLTGATNASYSIANVQPVHIGDYSVEVSAAGASSATSSVASLTIPGVPSGIWQGLVAYYTFESNGNDQTGRGNNATPSGNYQYLTSGLSGSAIRVIGDGSLYYAGGGHVLLPAFGNYMNSGFTVSLWAKDEVLGSPPVNNAGLYVSFGALNLPWLAVYPENQTRLITYEFASGSSGGQKITRPLNLPADFTVWKQVVVTYSPGKLVAYFNGSKIGEASITLDLFPASKAALGRSWWDSGSSSAARMPVTFDTVRIYSRALSDADVQQLYASEIPSVAPVFVTQPAAQTVSEGQSVTFGVSVSGTPVPTYQWRKDGTNIAGATSATFTIASPKAADAGNYTVVITNAAGSVASAAAALTVRSNRITNMSVRTNLATGQTLTVGFVTNGSKKMLVRAVGPSLRTVFGLTTFYPDPRLALVNQGTGAIVASNDNWPATLSAACTKVGAFPMDAGSRDAGLEYAVSGPHTAQVNGTGSGIVTVEAYDAETETPARLTNVSARNLVGTGADILIAGFVIDGNAPATMLIRGIGPALRDIWGISGALIDPKLEVYRQDGSWVGENDNWASALTPTFDQVGAYRFTIGSKDAAMLITLPPGVYTAQVSGVGGTTGDGVVEVFEVP